MTPLAILGAFAPVLFGAGLDAGVLGEAARAVVGARVEERIAALKAAGEPVSMADLAGEPVPDAENGALVYLKAIALLEAMAKQGGDGREPLSEFLSGEKRGPETWDAVRALVARAGPVFALVDEAAGRPRCRFPLKYEDGFAMQLSHLAKLREISRLLCAKAILEARDGKSAEAMRTMTRAFQAAESLRDEPLLISTLVRIAMLRIASVALREVVEWGDVSDADAEALAEVLVRVDLQAGMVRAIQSERVFGIWLFDKLRREGPQALKELGGEGIPEGGLFNAAAMLVWGPLLTADEGFYLDAMDRYVEQARRPWRETRGAEAGQEPPRYAIVSRTVVPALGNVAKSCDRGVADRAGSLALLGLLACKERWGAYPQSLAELRLRLEWPVPSDPFSGKDLIYRPANEGFLLYSIGDDLVDDGGRPIRALQNIPGAGLAPAVQPKPGEPDNADKGDIVWRRER